MPQLGAKSSTLGFLVSWVGLVPFALIVHRASVPLRPEENTTGQGVERGD